MKYNIIRFKDARICLILATKAANTSVKAVFAKHLGFYDEIKDCLHAHNGHFDYITPSEVSELGEGWHVLATCRHPYMRAISTWNEKVRRDDRPHIVIQRLGFQKDMSFAEFVDHLHSLGQSLTEAHLVAQTRQMVHNRKFLPTEVLPYEAIDTSWARIQQLWKEKTGQKLPPISGERHNVSKRNPVLLTDDVKRKLNEIYQEDFDRLNYAKRAE